MRQPDVIDTLLVAADPLVDTPHSDPDGPDALAVRERAARQGTPARRRWRIAIAGVVAGLLGAAGATVAYSSGDGRAGTSDGVVCNGSDTSDLQAGFDPRTEDPIAVCAQEWESSFGVPAPLTLTACVDPGVQGAIEVYPGPPEVCAEHESVLYTGPTDEQLRFAAFRDEVLALEATVDPGACVSFEQIRAALDPLLVKHQLEGWTYGTPTDNDAPCVQVEGLVEHSKTIVVSQHPRQ